MRPIQVFVVAASVAVSLFTRASADDAKPQQQYGSISGRFIFKGEIPKRKYAVQPGDRSLVKACPMCAKAGVVSDELIVDPKSKGIANIFIYLRKAPAIHPKLRKSTVKNIECRFKGCRLLPRALIARTDQTITIKNRDQCAHNSHANPIAQTGHY